MWIKKTINENYNMDDLMEDLMWTPVIVIFDIISLFLQPFYFVAYRKFKRINHYD